MTSAPVASDADADEPAAGAPGADAESTESLDPQERIRAWLSPKGNLVLLAVLIVSIAVLGKSADWLVDLASHFLVTGLQTSMLVPRVARNIAIRVWETSQLDKTNSSFDESPCK